MRICQIITRSDTLAGAQVHVRDLSLELLRLGHDVTVLVGQSGLFTDELETKGISFRSLKHLVREIRPYQDFCCFCELRAIIRSLKPDLVATHSSKAGWLGRIVGKSLGIPTVFTAHGWGFTEGVPELSRKIYSTAERVAAPFTNRIITVSEYDRQLALRYKIASPKKIVTVHNGVYDTSPRLVTVSINDPFRMIMVARFDVPKNHALLFKALAGLPNQNWQLDLIGDGPLRYSMETLALELGISKQVTFWGERSDVAEHLAKAQLFLLISNYEGFPLSILEAMRSRLPVIASDVGGIKEAVIDGENGFLIFRNDLTILQERLLRLMNNHSLCNSMGNAGRKRFEQKFTLERMVNDTLAVYEEALLDRKNSKTVVPVSL